MENPDANQIFSKYILEASGWRFDSFNQACQQAQVV